MQIPIYQIDAFAVGPFSGNPAAVCPLEAWLPDSVMQAIAAENNLSETAFFVPDGEAWSLRWFTPVTEVDLCGHATLASAYVIFRFVAPACPRAVFRTRKAGELVVEQSGELLALDFPALPATVCEPPPGLAAALGAEPEHVLAAPARDYLAVYRTPAQAAELAPDFVALKRLNRAVIVTAPGDGGTDFVSRFFAPSFGIDEDPVTGSAHCTLVPYWARRLGRNRLNARQLSRRGGSLVCENRGERVTIAGRAVLYLTGTLHL
jgi:predicted PhzF superfamily epimerase YddE/YHI9